MYIGVYDGIWRYMEVYVRIWGRPWRTAQTPGSRPDPSKLIILIICDSFWMCDALGNMLTRIVSNSHFGKRLGAIVFPFLGLSWSSYS